MNFDDYQRESRATAKELADPGVSATDEDFEVTLLFLALALNGEAGELGEKAKKYVREEDPQYLVEMYWELGDVLWYWSQLATLLDADASTIAADNLDKLLDREERDVILGQGDER